MPHTIEIESDHPLVDQVIANHAQALAEELDFDGTHSFAVTVKRPNGDVLTSWSGDLT